MKRGVNLTFVKRTEKAQMYTKNGVVVWIPNSAIVESKCVGVNRLHTIIVEDWLDKYDTVFTKVSLLELLDQKTFPAEKYTTGIKEEDFPEDLIAVQKEAVASAIQVTRMLIWLWTGCGKTKVGIELANTLFKNGKIKRLIWITPPIGEGQLRESFLRWLNPDIEIKIMSVNWFSYHVDLTITSEDVVIIDECHRLKNGIAIEANEVQCILSNNIRKSVYSAGYVYGLTATTCLNGELDLFGIFFALSKDIVVPKGIRVKSLLKYRKTRMVGVKSLLDLITHISPYLFHRKKEDFDDRQVIYKNHDLVLSIDESSMMNKLFNKNVGSNGKFNQNNIIETYSAMVESCYRSGGQMLKSRCLMGIFREIPDDDQVIIFGYTVNGRYSDISVIRQICQMAGVSTMELHGNRGADENNAAINLFREKKYKVLIASYGCGAEMLDFPNANHVVIFGHSLNPIHRFQGVGRIDRVTQTKPMNAYIIKISNSVEGYVDALYNRKMDFSKDISDYFKQDINLILNNNTDELS
jgi:superfamily II DNA or RNA helicase